MTNTVWEDRGRRVVISRFGTKNLFIVQLKLDDGKWIRMREFDYKTNAIRHAKKQAPSKP